MTIRDWTGRRSGKNLTVTGTDIATGAPAKITDIETIAVDQGQIIATAGDGERHQLLW